MRGFLRYNDESSNAPKEYTYLYESRAPPRPSLALLHIAKVAAVIIVIALFLEVFVFNINFYKR